MQPLTHALLRGLHLMAMLAAAPTSPAHAQTAYPQRPVQVIVGFPAGGSVDVMARNLVTAINAQLGGSLTGASKPAVTRDLADLAETGMLKSSAWGAGCAMRYAGLSRKLPHITPFFSAAGGIFSTAPASSQEPIA